MVSTQVFAGLMAQFEAGEESIESVIVDAALEGIEHKGFGPIASTKRIAADPESFAVVEPRKAVTLMGIRRTREGTSPYVRVFKMGDMAEYDSYMLSYYGPIVAIGPKTVTIANRIDGRLSRLSLTEFAWRNRDFTEAGARAENDIASQNF